jgi:hypothetical protein
MLERNGQDAHVGKQSTTASYSERTSRNGLIASETGKQTQNELAATEKISAKKRLVKVG